MPNKKLRAKQRISSPELLIRSVPEPPSKTIQNIAIALGGSPELDGKNQLLKIPCILVTEHDPFESVPVLLAGLHGTRRCCVRCWGGVGQSSTVPPICELCEPQ